MAYVNPQAVTGIYNTDATAINPGCGVIPSGGETSGAANVKHPTVVDCWVFGVTDYICNASDYGNAIQTSFSPCQLKTTTAVSYGDKLNIANLAGEFQKAPSSAQNVQYVAIESASANSFVWASPYSTSAAIPSPIGQTLEGRVTTNISTTSTTLVDMTGASVTMSISAGSKVFIEASYSTSTASVLGATTTLVLDIDGATDEGSASSFTLLANSTQGGAFTRLKTGLSAGSHTFKLKWATSTSTAQCRPVSNPTTEHATIVVMELKV